MCDGLFTSPAPESTGLDAGAGGLDDIAFMEERERGRAAAPNMRGGSFSFASFAPLAVFGRRAAPPSAGSENAVAESIARFAEGAK